MATSNVIKIGYGVDKLWAVVLSLVAIFVSSANASIADNGFSELRGLGEPASPGSMQNPGLVTPSTSGVADSFAQPSLRGPNVAPPLDSQNTITPINLKPSSPLILKQQIEKVELNRPLTLRGAVQFADDNYPNILKALSQERAAQKNVTVQKLNEYLPDSLFQFQDLLSSHNKLTQVFFGSPVFPAVAGPGTGSDSATPYFFSGAGFSLDWAPLDFGLHKARIEVSKLQYRQAGANLASTRLDTEVAAASAFLDVVEAGEQVKAMEENVSSFEQFNTIVGAQVRADLKPGADQSLSMAQLANSQNQLLRAKLAYDLAVANLANSIGVGGQIVSIEAKGIATESQPTLIQREQPKFEEVPILRASQAVLLTAMKQRKVLDKEYYPVFHFLGGFSLRGSGLGLNAGERQSLGGSGIVPSVPNYQLAMIVNWNFLDWFRLHAQKKVQDERIMQQRYDYDLVFKNLKTEDVRSRARVRTAVALAANMPVQVNAALTAMNQAQARYKTGLGSVAQVAEASQVLAQSRMQEAIARVGVWRALLSVASVHGDLKPFVAEADRIQKGL